MVFGEVIEDQSFACEANGYGEVERNNVVRQLKTELGLFQQKSENYGKDVREDVRDLLANLGQLIGRLDG